MSRRPQQLVLPLKATHGGRREGAGRPNRSGLQAHVRRPALNPRHPVHVTIKLKEGLPGLRRKDIFKCLRAAVKTARKRGFAVAHFAVLANHIHFILEPRGARLGKIFQSLSISFARRINHLLNREGAVLNERYHLHILKTPTEVRRALAYVLTNEHKHQDPSRKLSREVQVKIDPFSSAHAFNGWSALGLRPRFHFSGWNEDAIESWYSEFLVPAATWLLKRGWLRART